jgi:molybdate transport system substrate-binding protein
MNHFKTQQNTTKLIKRRKEMSKVLKKSIVILVIFAIACAMTGCQASVPVEKTELTISAAASLTDAMAEIKDLYEKENVNTKLTINLASSGALAAQIEQGAEVDVFMSASKKYMDNVEEAELLKADTRIDLLKNEVVLIVPNDSNNAIDSFDQLIDPAINKIAIGEPGTVPAGKYAEEVFSNMNLTEKIQDKLIFGKDVREVLTWVETGNVDAGVVYSTDAKISDQVRVAAIAAEDSHKPIIYPAAIINSSKNTKGAENFMTFISSDDAKTIFEKYGFITE